MSIDPAHWWLISHHEGGHAVIEHVLGGTVYSLNLCDDGSGLARIMNLCPYRHAVAVAAGPAAERLLANEPAPPISTGAEPLLRSVSDAQLTAFARAAGVKPRPMPDSDERHMALWAITGYEHEPERWLPRMQIVKGHAEALVAEHRELILKVARALFAKGELTKADLAELLPPRKENEVCPQL